MIDMHIILAYLLINQSSWGLKLNAVYSINNDDEVIQSE